MSILPTKMRLFVEWKTDVREKIVKDLVSGVICLLNIRWWLTKPNEISMASVKAMSIEYIIVMAHFFSQQLCCCHNCILASTALMNRGKIDNKWTQHIQFQGPPMRCYHHYRIIEINYQMVKKYVYMNTHKKSEKTEYRRNEKKCPPIIYDQSSAFL